MTDPFRGVFVILPTAFDASGALDEDDLRRTVAFSIDCGVHGLVTPANASEGPYLSDSERRRVVEIVAEEADARVPLVVSVTASCASLAVEWIHHAESCGADMLMAMPPHVQRATDAVILDYYDKISNASSRPVIVQNFSGAGGTPMSAGFVTKLVSSLPGLDYVKEETDLPGPMITKLLEDGGASLKGVMGGKAGRQLPEEHARGACGTMPACQIADVHCRLWAELEAGDTAAARETYRRLLPLLLFETIYGVAVYKEVLWRRGVIDDPFFRQAAGRPLDREAQRELSVILEELEPLLDDRYPVVKHEIAR